MAKEAGSRALSISPDSRMVGLLGFLAHCTVQGLQGCVGRTAEQKWGHSLGLHPKVSLRSAYVSLDERV